MQRDEIRLECAKLVHRKDRSNEANVKEARVIEKYILEETEVCEKTKPVSKKIEDKANDIMS